MTTIDRNAPIFVFGSNLAGRHGKGAAVEARTRWGARPGVGVGHTGHAYAIPTKSEYLRRLPLDAIAQHVTEFLAYARRHPELRFRVTRVGCGYAGYYEQQMRPLFAGAPPNCLFDWDAPGPEIARCERSNNPCGTDTHPPDRPCRCGPCRGYAYGYTRASDQIRELGRTLTDHLEHMRAQSERMVQIEREHADLQASASDAETRLHELQRMVATIFCEHDQAIAECEQCAEQRKAWLREELEKLRREEKLQ